MTRYDNRKIFIEIALPQAYQNKGVTIMKPKLLRFSTDYFKKGTQEIVYIGKNIPKTSIKYMDKIKEFVLSGNKRKEQFRGLLKKQARKKK